MRESAAYGKAPASFPPQLKRGDASSDRLPPDRNETPPPAHATAPAATRSGVLFGKWRARWEDRLVCLCNLKGQPLYSGRTRPAGPASASHRRVAEERDLKPHIQQLCARLRALAQPRPDRGRAPSPGVAEAVSVRLGSCLHHVRGLLLEPATAGEPLILVVVDTTSEPKRTPLDLTYLKNAYNLTSREIEVLDYVRQGASYKEMAQELGISPHTIRDHILKLKLKFQTVSRCGIMARLIEESCHS